VKKYLFILLFSLLLGTACAENEILPGWQANSATYNSCTDIYKDGAVLAGDYVFCLEMYTTKNNVGKALVRWEYDNPENTVVLRDLGLWNSQFLLDAGDGLLVTDADRGKVFWMDYNGQNERLLFCTQEKRPAFEFLVGDKLYYEACNSIYYYNITEDKTYLLCDGTIKEDLAWNEIDAIFAEGKIYMAITQYGLYSADVITGEIKSYHETVPAPIIDVSYFDGYLYVHGEFCRRIDPETGVVKQLEKLPNACPVRVFGNHVLIQENSWDCTITGWYKIPPEGFGDFSFVTEENRKYDEGFSLGEKVFIINHDRIADGADIGRELTGIHFWSYRASCL